MPLHIEKEVSDIRGKILFLSDGSKNINIVEIKKGFARGGHYHKSEQIHLLLTGKIEYRESTLIGKEITRMVSAPDLLKIPANMAHLFIAIEDTVFAEIFDNQYEATDYPKYRMVVEELMNNS